MNFKAKTQKKKINIDLNEFLVVFPKNLTLLNVSAKTQSILNEKNLKNNEKQNLIREKEDINILKNIKELENQIITKEKELNEIKIPEKDIKKIIELDELAKKWKKASQEALWDLLSEYNKREETSITMINLLKILKIEPEFIGFDIENEDFI